MREMKPALNCGPQMKTDVPSTTTSQFRCAIYTRKSTEEGLDQDFNSLDAQREAAEAFIRSQRSEGLVALPERYDDGGFGGGNRDRPALERLLADVRGGAVDCVVVYKVDRLSRSLIDFAHIIEIFDRCNVSFVSVTQQFNTTNSLGRLTLNILLSFAQFEREIIAERTRDKMSAARRKGKWIGGRPMLGYDIDPRGSRLIVNGDETIQVRMIFRLYLDHNTLMPVVREIDRRGWRTKQWITKAGASQGGKRFTKGRLFRLLTNLIYVGKIGFEKQVYEGEHAAIIEADIWEHVQQILRRNGRDGGAEVRDSFGTVLRRLLRCASCDAGMACIYTTDESCRYRSYVCEQTQQGGHAKRVSESAIKAAMTSQIRGIGSAMRIVAHTFAKAEEQRRISVATLTLEREVAQRALASMRTELRKLLVVDCRDQPTTDRLADLQERIGQTEHRLTEIVLELEHLESEVVDEGDLRTTLARFDPVWEALNSWERVLIIRSLIERVTYNGNSNKLTVRFISAGIREMCRCNWKDGAQRSIPESAETPATKPHLRRSSKNSDAGSTLVTSK
jgi:site-specific DNA recombinase